MKLFSTVAIVTDHTMVEDASALRAVLEAFSVRVEFFRLVQRPQVLSFFQQEQQQDYTIIFCHGNGEPPGDLHLALKVVDQKDGDYEAPEGWAPTTVKVTPAFVKENIRGRVGTLISTACGSGRRPLADAFIDAGYNSYIAPVEPYYNSQAGIAFLTSFFYLLLSEDRDYAEIKYSEVEAVQAAVELDSEFAYGPNAFRRYTRNGYDPRADEVRGGHGTK